MPIIESLLDVDFYKFTMGQMVFLRYPDVPVTYALTNRTREIRLASVVDEVELREELDHARSLRFNNSELHYLRGTNEYGDRMFSEDYLDFLRGLALPEYELDQVDGSFQLSFTGLWSHAIYWETIALALLSELYYRSLMRKLSTFEKDLVYAEGKMRLANKIRVLREHPQIEFVDFGTSVTYTYAGSETADGDEAPPQPMRLRRAYAKYSAFALLVQCDDMAPYDDYPLIVRPLRLALCATLTDDALSCAAVARHATPQRAPRRAAHRRR